MFLLIAAALFVFFLILATKSDFLKIVVVCFAISAGSIYGFAFGARALNQVILQSNRDDLSSGGSARHVFLENQEGNIRWINSIIYSPQLLLVVSVFSLVMGLLLAGAVHFMGITTRHVRNVMMGRK